MKLRIKEVAKQKKKQLKDICEATGITKYMMSYYNAGTTIIPLNKLEDIANYLQCDVLELLEPSSDEYGHFYLNGEWQGIRK